MPEAALCTNPREFNGVVIACHKCSQCLQYRVDNIVGRCIAEQRLSRMTYTVTLTYGGDDRLTGEVPIKARILDFRDVSLYVKRLRNFVKVRYVAAGEYGTQNHRAHWHLVVFTNGEIPNLVLDRRYNHRGPGGKMLWNDGYSYWEEATYERIRYACGYVLKAVDASRNAERRWGASRQPPLGREYFRLLAQQHVEQGLSPQDCWYSFPEVKNKDGTLRRFNLTRSSANYYKQDFIDGWRRKYGNDDWPQSDMLDEYLDQQILELGHQPGDWLEDRRFRMERAEKSWDGSRVSFGISVGMIAARAARAETNLDDRLRTMGNRKGRGHLPEGETPIWTPSSMTPSGTQDGSNTRLVASPIKTAATEIRQADRGTTQEP